MHMSGELAGADFIVVGAGAVGSSISYRLAQSGAQVTIVESNYPAGGTSGNSVAWLNGFNKHPRDYYRLNVNSIRDHRELEDELGGNWLTQGGGLHWSDGTGAGYTSDLEGTVKRLRAWGARIESHTPMDIMSHIEPDLCLDPDVVETVYIVRDEGWVQAAVMVQALIERASRGYGAKLVYGTVCDLQGKSGEVDTVVLESGERLSADVVIVAGGAQAGRLAAMAGSSIPIEQNAGVLAVTAPAPVGIKRVIVGPGIILRPDGGGRLLMASDPLLSVPAETVPSQEMPEMGELLERARCLVPSLHGVPIEAFRMGIRPVPRDGYPIVGFDPNVHGLYYAVTHSGITLSACLGNLVADDLITATSDVLDAYRPERFFNAKVSQGPTGE